VWILFSPEGIEDYFTVVLEKKFSIIIRDMEEGNYIVLASNSPRRKELLELTGLPFRVVPPSGEPLLEKGEGAEEFVRRSSLAKALGVSVKFPRHWVVGADTVVVCDGRVLGKPGDEKEAVRILSFLSGKTHEVMTGVCLVNESLSVRKVEVSRTLVEFRKLDEGEIDAYVRTGEPLDKAGAYGIQGLGAVFVKRVEGSYTNVVGMPLALLVEMLKKEGVIKPCEGRGRLYKLLRRSNPLEGGMPWGKSLKM